MTIPKGVAMEPVEATAAASPFWQRCFGGLGLACFFVRTMLSAACADTPWRTASTMRA